MPKMTLSLPDNEWDDLTNLATDKSESKTTVIRQAIRAFIHMRRFEKDGDRISVESRVGVRRFEVTFL